MDQKETFEKAVATSKTLPAKPDNETLLRLYSLYKQSTEGDINIDAPNMFDFVAKAKYDAWLKLKGVTTDSAMRQYVDLVTELADKNSLKTNFRFFDKCFRHIALIFTNTLGKFVK